MIGLQGVPLEKNPDEEKKMQTDPSIAAQPAAVAPVDAKIINRASPRRGKERKV
jgi:hypothetical protein